MEGTGADLSVAEATARDAAREWGLELEEPYALSNYSYVAPAGEVVVKVPWEGDDESLHEGEALELWDGDGAIRLHLDPDRLAELRVLWDVLNRAAEDLEFFMADLARRQRRLLPHPRRHDALVIARIGGDGLQVIAVRRVVESRLVWGRLALIRR